MPGSGKKYGGNANMDILGVFHLIIERHNIVIVQFARLNVELLFRNKLFFTMLIRLYLLKTDTLLLVLK